LNVQRIAQGIAATLVVLAAALILLAYLAKASEPTTCGSLSPAARQVVCYAPSGRYLGDGWRVGV
jgi:hypothetical protein